jgi:hypothetical protein
MWLNTPRITRVDDAAITAAQAEALEPFYWRTPANILLTLAKNPEALTCLTPWLEYFSSPKNHIREVRGRSRSCAQPFFANPAASGCGTWPDVWESPRKSWLVSNKGPGWLERGGGSVDPSCRRDSPGFLHR